MTRRPASWQAEKARTKKALGELPRCTTQGCTGRAMGYSRAVLDDEPVAFRLVCPRCAMAEQRAQREKR